MSQTNIRQEIAQRRIKEFEQKFGRNTLHLAYHASLPVALNSELLHLLRINFFLDPPEALPYTAELDLLLSPLCQEIGEDLYEIDSTVRKELLKGLGVESGHERLREVAALLWEYTERGAAWADNMRLEHAQQLTALNFLEPQKAEQWLEEANKYLEGVAIEEGEWVVAMRQELEHAQQLTVLNFLDSQKAEQWLEETDKYLEGVATEEGKSVMAMRQELENIKRLQIEKRKKLDAELPRADGMIIHLPLKQIIDGCRQKQEGKCFELFRRAFDEHNEEAKIAVYHQYRRLVFDWTHKALASYPLTEQEVEDITSKATVKFFRHLSRISVVERYEHVAQILGYCKKCVKSAAIDFTRKAMRAKRNQDEWIDKTLERRVSSSSPEEEVKQQQLRQKIREIMDTHFDEVEKLYIQLKFEEGLTPRQMVEMYPQVFPNSREVYKIWDRVNKRLRPLFKIYST